ncbi:DNA-3-methyladenine glycosylase I [Enterococcus sp. LJL99]
MEKIRCDWANSNELEASYHDNEWGNEVHDDGQLFEFLVLESMQAGLSWSTILKKRETLSAAFDQFDYHKIATYTEEKVAFLLQDPGIIRNKLKVQATINNAKIFLAIQQEYGSFNEFIWSYVNHQPIKNSWTKLEEVPASTTLSDEISKELKKKGFKFLGTTTVYAFMQATGMVNDHLSYCYKNNQK